jgi:thioredoxin 1
MEIIMSLLEIKESNFEEEVLKYEGTVLVDFWAPWCRPCRMQTPILERVAESGDISAKIAKVNTDESSSIAQKYDISSIPTLILFKEGKEVERMVGVQPEDVLKKKLK